MRVFCHEHKRGFLAPRQSPIKCENRGHVLGEIDLNGVAKESFHTQWQYCCNCEHFSVVNFETDSLERCQVCTRRASMIYLCERCYTLSFESNTPLQTKNFTLTDEGAPKPCCPACLQSASADLREHTCNDAKASFVTSLNTCPICAERLDVGPTFPSSVADYLRKTKVANKLFVTFDYETGLFAAVDDGEFVVVSNHDEEDRTFLLPRSSRLASLREFYELYQDYYLCLNPDTGEINISEPAVVVPMTEGWKLLKTGIFQVVSDPRRVESPPAGTQPRRVESPPAGTQPRRVESPPVVTPPRRVESAPVVTPPRRVESPPVVTQPRRVESPPVVAKPAKVQTPRREEPAVMERQEEDSTATPCAKCNTPVEEKYAFCWKCGHPRETNDKAERPQPQRSRLIVSAIDDEEERTVQHESRATDQPSNFTSIFSAVKNRQSRSNGSVLRLFGIGLAGVLGLTLTLFTITRSRTTNVTAAQPEAPVATQNTTTTTSATESVPPAEIKRASLQVPEPAVEDSALARLRQIRNNSDPSKVLKGLSATEKQFADDYRFPYERARAVVKTNKKNYPVDAFAALARAAQKAINKGKANEMLQSLKTDSSGDFQKLAHGHREWTQLQKALKNKDVTALEESQGF